MKLLPHQIDHSDKIASGDDLPNFSEAGTGKTITMLEAIKKAGFERGVVVAPGIALPMWKKEMAKYGLYAHILKTGKSPLKGNCDFHLVTYGLVINRDMYSRLSALGGDVLILDESHYLKERTSKRTKAIFGPSTTGRSGLYEDFTQTWSMTGTPQMRHADDLWSQLRAIAPNELREHDVLKFEDFQRKFTFGRVVKHHPRMQPRWTTTGSQNEQLLNKLLYEDIGAVRALMLDVQKDMPPLTFRDIGLSVKRSAELTAALKGIDLENLESTFDSGETAKALRLLGELKIEPAVEYIVEEHPHGPVLVGYWHTDTGASMAEKLRKKGLDVAIVKGGMSADSKEDIREAFNRGQIDVLLGQISAMNVSWNLQELGKRVMILEDQFSPGLIEQFVKRVWRFGQGNHVQVDFLKATGNELDEAISRVRERKEASAMTSVG